MRAIPLTGRPLHLVVLVTAAGVAALTHSVIALDGAGSLLARAAWILGVAASCGWLQAHAFTFVWRSRRVSVYADEAVLMAAVLALPGPDVVLAAAAGSVAAQVALGRPPVKSVFNVGAQAASTWLAVAAFHALAGLGAPALLAAAVVPLVVSAANQTIVAALLAAIAGEPLRTLPRSTLGASIAIAGGGGLVLGSIAIALYQLHPAALALFVPAAWLGLEAMSAGYRHHNEFGARSTLNRAARGILAARTAPRVVETVLAACMESFAAHEAAWTPRGAPEPARALRTAPPARETRLASSVLDASGSVVGELAIRLARKSRTDHALDQRILDLAASYVSLGLANVDALESLARAERRLRHVLEAAPDPIVLVAPRGERLYENPAASARDGVPSALDALAPASRDALASAVARPVAGAARVELESEVGERAWEALVTRMPLDDEPDARLVLMRDITERRRLEAERREHERQLEQSERLAALGTLVAGVAHEVNNPLMYMTGGLDLSLLDLADLEPALADREADRTLVADTIERLKLVKSGANRIAGITSDLQIVASASERTGNEFVRLAALAAEVEAELSPTLPEGVRIALVNAGDPAVVGSFAALRRVALSLAKNAAEALAQGPGTIEITVAERGESAVLAVRDDGPGMEEDVQQRAFTPFFTTKHDGVGLGLPTALAIVRSHGGRIELASAPGAGATLTVTLPRASPEVTLAAARRGGAGGRHDKGGDGA